MKMYVGGTTSKSHLEKLIPKRVGRVNNPGKRFFVPYDGEDWIADNGAYSYWVNGKRFDNNRYERYLERCSKLDSKPTFGVLPDIVAGGAQSLEFSMWWLTSGKLPEDWRWYFVLQDGMSVGDVEQCRGCFDGLFLGGTIRFKIQAYMWVQFGKRCGGIPLHFGRCGPHYRMHHAALVGCSSADSTYPIWNRTKMDEFLETVDDDGHYDINSWKGDNLDYFKIDDSLMKF